MSRDRPLRAAPARLDGQDVCVLDVGRPGAALTLACVQDAVDRLLASAPAAAAAEGPTLVILRDRSAAPPAPDSSTPGSSAPGSSTPDSSAPDSGAPGSTTSGPGAVGPWVEHRAAIAALEAATRAAALALAPARRVLCLSGAFSDAAIGFFASAPSITGLRLTAAPTASVAPAR